MRLGETLEREARDVAQWLAAHPEDLAPLRIVRVDSELGADDDGEPVIKLTVVLEDPDDPDVGWPVEAMFRLYRVANERAQKGDHSMFAYIHPLSVSDEAA